MADIILVTGGSRSGKSAYAQQKAESINGKKLYIATCPHIDPELDYRIQNHVAQRKGKGWHTLEEEVELEQAIRLNHSYEILLIDCLTLWINNLLYLGEKENNTLCEDDIAVRCKNVVEECRKHPGTIFLVTNEVGSGIVPESSYTRLYRDMVGRSNQVIAAAAVQVTLVSCGIPLHLKSKNG